MVLAARALAKDAQAVALDVNGERAQGAFNRSLRAGELQQPLKVTNAGDAPVQAVVTVSGAPLVPEGAAEKAAAMEDLDPLAVTEIRLAPWHVVELSSVDENDLYSPRFEHFVDGYPVHVRALHGHRLHALLDQPVRKLVQLVRRRREDSNVGLAVVSRWAAHPVLRAAHVDAGNHRPNGR